MRDLATNGPTGLILGERLEAVWVGLEIVIAANAGVRRRRKNARAEIKYGLDVIEAVRLAADYCIRIMDHPSVWNPIRRRRNHVVVDALLQQVRMSFGERIDRTTERKLMKI